MSSVGSRYAEALIRAAEEEDAVTRVREEFGMLQDAFRDCPELRALITKDLIPEEEKEKLLFSVFVQDASAEQEAPGAAPDAEGTGVSRLFAGFLKTLSDHRRLSFLPDIHEAFEKCFSEYLHAQGILEAEAVTAVEMTDEETQALVDALSEKHGMKILLKKRVDPSILGGMVIYTGCEVQDCSVRNRYESLRRHLKSVQLQ